MRVASGLAIVLCTLAVPTAATAGGEPTRADYVRQADAICKPANERSQALFDRGDRLIERGRESAGANLFIRAYRDLIDVARDELRRLPPPPADARRVDRWLDLEIAAAATLVKGWRQFKKGDIERAIELGVRGERLHDRAHRAIKGFDFRSCA